MGHRFSFNAIPIRINGKVKRRADFDILLNFTGVSCISELSTELPCPQVENLPSFPIPNLQYHSIQLEDRRLMRFEISKVYRCEQ